MKVKFKKWVSVTAASILLAASFLGTATTASADEVKERTIADESIYDLLVDRFFNGVGTNDFDTNAKDPTKFAGGDFQGMIDKIDFIGDMGFSIISIGSIFSNEKYEGSLPTSYTDIEKHFGTKKELKKVIETFNKRKMEIMIDFPLNNVSANHEWAQDSAKKDWIASSKDGIVQWDLANKDVQAALIDAATQFVSTYAVGGVRLTNLQGADTAFINDMIKALKAENKELYIISNEESDAKFDAIFEAATNGIYRDIFKNVDRDSSKLLEPVAGDRPAQIMMDTLDTERFTFQATKEDMFQPTRMKMVLGAMFTLPGIPVIQYGTEIAMSGESAPDTQQFYNFKVNEELVEYVGDLQVLRNQSETLRTGKFEVIKNEDGLLAFKRSSKDETWIIMINNTSKTQRVDFTFDELGKDKEIKGTLESEIIRANDKDVYPVILDREMVEIYQVKDDTGINMSYVIALGFVYVFFTVFVIVIIRRGKKRRQQQDIAK
ncbi:MAG: alpha-amylase family glycosyl hydrolase [Lysinibacillus sp.]